MPHFTTKDGCRIFHALYGADTSTPFVVFLNGTTQTTLYWGSVVPAFSKRFRLLLYDARAQGQSDLGTLPISPDLHVADLKNLLDHLTVEKAHLVGISHGARVALAFAAAFPQTVDHLVLCSIGARSNARANVIVRSWLEILRRSDVEAMAWAALPTVFGENFLKHHQKMLNKIVAAVVKRNRKKALIAQLDAVLKYPPPDRLQETSHQRMLVISGSQDLLADPEEVRQLAKLCNARHESISGVGHSIPAEAPRRFQQMVLEFLTQG